MEAKKIIITGGATRIGAAIAKSLATYDTKIAIHFNKSRGSALKLKKELEELGAEVYLFKADLNNLNQTSNLIKNVYTKMRGLDCLINNASIFENDNLENFSVKSITKHINTDTRTDDKVIIECIHIPVAPMKASNNAVMVANLRPTVKYPMITKTVMVYHQGI